MDEQTAGKSSWGALGEIIGVLTLVTSELTSAVERLATGSIDDQERRHIASEMRRYRELLEHTLDKHRPDAEGDS